MKIIRYIMFLVTIIPIGCEELSMPDVNQEDQFALYCFINSESSSHESVIKKIFYLDDDSEKISSRPINISITDGDSIFHFENLTENPDNMSEHIMNRLNGWKPKKSVIYNLTAEVSNNITLESRFGPLIDLYFEWHSSDKSIPDNLRGDIIVSWNSNIYNAFYSQKVYIEYYNKVDSAQTIKLKKVPLQYIDYRGEHIPEFYSLSRDKNFSIHQTVIDRAMRDVSEGDIVKSNYIIKGIYLKVTAYDENISSYFLENKNANDEFSRNYSDSDFSNVEGGKGVVGTYSTKKWIFNTARNYIESFGYAAD